MEHREKHRESKTEREIQEEKVETWRETTERTTVWRLVRIAWKVASPSTVAQHCTIRSATGTHTQRHAQTMHHYLKSITDEPTTSQPKTWRANSSTYSIYIQRNKDVIICTNNPVKLHTCAHYIAYNTHSMCSNNCKRIFHLVRKHTRLPYILRHWA